MSCLLHRGAQLQHMAVRRDDRSIAPRGWAPAAARRCKDLFGAGAEDAAKRLAIVGPFRVAPGRLLKTPAHALTTTSQDAGVNASLSRMEGSSSGPPALRLGLREIAAKDVRTLVRRLEFPPKAQAGNSEDIGMTSTGAE